MTNGAQLSIAIAASGWLAISALLFARRLRAFGDLAVPRAAKRVLLGFGPVVGSLLLVGCAALLPGGGAAARAVAILAAILVLLHFVHLWLLYRLALTAHGASPDSGAAVD